MSATPVRWTASQLAVLPDDGKRYEIIDGALFVTPAPTWRHQRAVRNLVALLLGYTAETGLVMMFAPAAVTFSETTVVEPDLFVVPRRPDGSEPDSLQEAGRMLLTVEILSPSSGRADRGVKRRLYQQEGVDEFWVIDLDAAIVERWRPADELPQRLDGRMEWRPVAGVRALSIDWPAFFAGVSDG